MPVPGATIGDEIRHRRHRNHFTSSCNHDLLHHHHHHQQAESDPNPQLSRSSKSAISSLFLSPFSASSAESAKKKGAAAFRGMGCAAGAARQVSVPAMIRSSAEWEGKKVKKKMKMKNKEVVVVPGVGEVGSSSSNNGDGSGGLIQGNCMVIQDVWCGPGIGFSPDAVVDSVDCVVTARRNPSGRGKIDVEKFNPREREREREREVKYFIFSSVITHYFSNGCFTVLLNDFCYLVWFRDAKFLLVFVYMQVGRPCLPRRAAVDPEAFSFWDADPAAFGTLRPETEMSGSRYYRHLRRAPPDGLAEMLILQNGIVMGGRLDRFNDWRLDIDSMSYEQLLELEDRIGYVSTGLKEDEIGHCIRKYKLSVLSKLPSHIHTTLDKKCSVCQEEYEGDDEVGKLECGHGFHIQCIKQWLAHKNNCPVCKTAPLPRS
ncbi:Probable E3 ubiquitin-protein ligase RHG1A [Linum perenne]